MTDPHLDDEQLSLLLDGVEVDGRAHAGDCRGCGDRLAALRSARDAVAGAAVAPLPADVLDRLVSAALEAPPAVEADVVPLASRRRRITTPPPAWLVGAAAGIAALVGVAGLLRAVDVTSGDDDRGSMALTAGDESAESQADASKQLPANADGEASATAGGTATAAPAPFDPERVSADLADQDDPAELAALLGNVATSSGTDAFSAARESAATPAAGGAAADAGAAPPATTTPTDRARCRAAADRIGAGRLGQLLSTATLRWKGEPAEVLVFGLAEPSTGEEAMTRQALVLSRPDCRLLADPRF